MPHKQSLLLTGTHGMLGTVLAPILDKEFVVIPSDRSVLDITDQNQTRTFISQKSLDIIVHLAAITDLELCESNHALADRVNIQGTRNLIDAIDRQHTVFVYLSTDAVYDYDSGSMKGFSETDPCIPPNYYGQTKWEAEKLVRELPKHYILRTTWLYGGEKDKKFLKKVLPRVERKETVSVVNDVYGSPTSVYDLSYLIRDILLGQIPFGVYNTVNSEYGSRLDMIMHAANVLGLDTQCITSVSSQIYPQTLKRHNYAILNNEKIAHALYTPRHWKTALSDYLLNDYS